MTSPDPRSPEPPPSSPSADPPPSSGGGRRWLGLLVVLAIVAVLAIAALTMAGGRVDRLLGETKSAMPAPEMDSLEGGRGPAAEDTSRDPGDPGGGDDPYEPTNPEGGMGGAGHH